MCGAGYRFGQSESGMSIEQGCRLQRNLIWGKR